MDKNGVEDGKWGFLDLILEEFINEVFFKMMIVFMCSLYCLRRKVRKWKKIELWKKIEMGKD